MRLLFLGKLTEKRFKAYSKTGLFWVIRGSESIMEENLKNEIIELIKENSRPDSIELGDTKNGKIKVYLNFDNETESVAKLKKAIKILKDNRKDVYD